MSSERRRGAGTSERPSAPQSHWSTTIGELTGEVFRGVTGGLVGVYEVTVDAAPPSGLFEAVEHQVHLDRQSLRHERGETKLGEWFGGWTPEGVGRFEAEIWIAADRGHQRRAGRVRLVVRPAHPLEAWQEQLPSIVHVA